LSYRQSGTGYAVGLPAAGKHLYHNAKKQIMLNLISLGRAIEVLIGICFRPKGQGIKPNGLSPSESMT